MPKKLKMVFIWGNHGQRDLEDTMQAYYEYLEGTGKTHDPLELKELYRKWRESTCGEVQEVEFDTEAERDGYIRGVNDAIGWMEGGTLEGETLRFYELLAAAGEHVEREDAETEGGAA